MRFYLLTIFCILISSCQQSQRLADSDTIIKQLDSLLENQEVFKGYRLFEQEKNKLPEIDRLIFTAKIGNCFNDPEKSNDSISYLFQHYLSSLNDSTRCKLLELELENDIKLFNYKQAADVSHELTENYTSYLDSTKIAELKNESNIWNGLRNSPAQLVVKKNYTKINLVDGLKIPVSFNNSDSNVNMLFDTGANISVIIESTAKSMGLQFLDASCKVKSILGNEVSAKIALAKLMLFGSENCFCQVP